MRWWMGFMVGCLWFGGVAEAHPTGGLPEVSLGENPYRVFSSFLEMGSSEEVFTVPPGQDFIVTTIFFPHPFGTLLVDGTTAIEGSLLASNFVRKGVGRLRVQEGSTISLEVGPGYAARFSIHGYLVNAGSPYRFVSGQTGTDVGTTKTIFSTGADQSFIVRSLVIRSSSGCDINVGELGFDKDFNPFNHSFTDSAYSSQLGTLVIPPDSALTATVRSGPAVGCEYLMSGEYITP